MTTRSQASFPPVGEQLEYLRKGVAEIIPEAELVTKLEVRWPSGIRQVLENVKADQQLTVKEPER